VVAYDAVLAEALTAVVDGTMMRGEVLAGWQEFVGTGELLRALESRIGQLRDKVVSAVVETAGDTIAGLEGSPQTEAIAADAKFALSEGTKYAAFAAAGFLALGLLSTISLGRGVRPTRSGAEEEPTEEVTSRG